MRKALALLPAILSLSCAWTRIDSQINPEYSTHEYNNILVFVELHDLGARQSAENRLQYEMTEYRVNSAVAYELLFPGRSYSEDEVLDLLDYEQIDAVLIVDPYATGTTQDYISPSTSTKTRGTISKRLFSDDYTFESESKTKTTGGYYVSKPWARFTAQLIDAKSGETVWLATATSRGNAFATWNTLMNSVATKIVDELAKTDLLRQTVPPEEEPERKSYQHRRRLP